MPAPTCTELDPLPRIIRKIPKECFVRDERRAFRSLIRDVALLALGITGVLVAPHWAVAFPFSLLVGFVLTGLFVLGHDAGHRSFAKSERKNDLVGELTLALTLWPFHVWRLSHDHHHRYTHHATEDNAWCPLTVAQYLALPGWKRFFYRQTRTTYFYFASVLFQCFAVYRAAAGQYHDHPDAAKVRRSLVVMLTVSLLYAGASYAARGLYGLVFLFAVPQLVYQFWLSTFTLFHHTSPETTFLSKDEWTPERAQLSLSVHVHYPRLVDWLTHDISWHVPHHVCVGIPHHALRTAHAALKAAYPAIVQERRLTRRYVRRLLATCHLIRSADDVTWVAFKDAHAALPQAALWAKAPDHRST